MILLFNSVDMRQPQFILYLKGHQGVICYAQIVLDELGSTESMNAY